MTEKRIIFDKTISLEGPDRRNKWIVVLKFPFKNSSEMLLGRIERYWTFSLLIPGCETGLNASYNTASQFFQNEPYCIYYPSGSGFIPSNSVHICKDQTYQLKGAFLTIEIPQWLSDNFDPPSDNMKQLELFE